LDLPPVRESKNKGDIRRKSSTMAKILIMIQAKSMTVSRQAEHGALPQGGGKSAMITSSQRNEESPGAGFDPINSYSRINLF